MDIIKEIEEKLSPDNETTFGEIIFVFGLFILLGLCYLAIPFVLGVLAIWTLQALGFTLSSKYAALVFCSVLWLYLLRPIARLNRGA